MDIREQEIRAFEDFQRHQRHEQQEYEIGRNQLRSRAQEAAARASGYQYVVSREDGMQIEPIFTLADRQFLGELRVGY